MGSPFSVFLYSIALGLALVFTASAAQSQDADSVAANPYRMLHTHPIGSHEGRKLYRGVHAQSGTSITYEARTLVITVNNEEFLPVFEYLLENRLRFEYRGSAVIAWLDREHTRDEVTADIAHLPGIRRLEPQRLSDSRGENMVWYDERGVADSTLVPLDEDADGNTLYEGVWLGQRQRLIGNTIYLTLSAGYCVDDITRLLGELEMDVVNAEEGPYLTRSVKLHFEDMNRLYAILRALNAEPAVLSAEPGIPAWF